MAELLINIRDKTIWESELNVSGLLQVSKDKINSFLSGSLATNGDNYDAVEADIIGSAWTREEEKIATEAIIKERGTWKEGDIVSAISDTRRRQVWVQMICRGTHGYEEIPFNEVLFNLYMKLTNNRRKRLSDNDYQTLETEIANKGLTKNAPFVELGTKKVSNVWPWGTKDKQLFLILTIPFATKQEVTKMEIGEKKIVNGEQILNRRRGKRLDFMANKITCGLDKTLAEISADITIPSQSKTWYNNNIIRNPSSTLLNVLFDSSITLPNRYYLPDFSPSLVQDK